MYYMSKIKKAMIRLSWLRLFKDEKGLFIIYGLKLRLERIKDEII